MDSSKLGDSLRTIRRELVIKDEPLKAYELLSMFDHPDLKEEKKKSYGMVRHYYDPKEYLEAYDIPVPDAEIIEAEEFALDAGKRYPRYGWILDELDKEKAKSILDLGCYVGSVVLTAAHRGFTAYGVDMTKGSIDIANKRKKKYKLDKAKFYLGDVTKFDKHKADLVMSFEVLEHVVHPDRYIRHMARLANKWAYVSTPDGPFENGKGNLEMEGGWEWDGKGVRGHLRVFTKDSLTRLIESCNCEIKLIEGRDDGLLHAKFRGKL